MAQHRPEICAALVVLVSVLYCRSSMGGEIPKLCDIFYPWNPQHCHHNQSKLCGFGNETVSCTHQLYQKELTSDMPAAECQVEMFAAASDCGSLQPAQVYIHEKPLVRLHLYHYHTWFGRRAVVNFTFPSPDWSSLKFQYKVNNSRQSSRCRQFSLHGVELPLSDTLVYDCVMFDVPGNVARDAEVTVENDRGEGRTFLFRIPSHSRISPWDTRLSEWHVFFYLHQDFIAMSSHLPVTVQSAAHFHSVSYRVSIVKCQNAKSPDCNTYAVLNSTLVVDPKDKEWTVQLPIWSNPGSYAVTVQIVSDECPREAGCYVSVSPKFEIESSLLGIWISVGMGFFLISFLTFLLMFNQRLRTNKSILLALRETQPTVLLVYLPENQPYLKFINMFADFLKNTCHLLPYLVDHDVGIQDPNCWTRDHINRADRVLFIVPGNPDGESITPIRNQWIVALNYLSGHHFTKHHLTRKVAAVILPSSGSIPCEISHVQRFKLVDQIAALVTWLHSGTLLDEVFLWRPKIRSSSREKISYTWSEMRDAALMTSSSTRRLSKTHTGIAIMSGIIVLTNDDQTALRDADSIHSKDSTTTDCNSEVNSSVFDPDIPSLNRLQIGEGTKLTVNSQDSDEISDIGDDDGIFT